MAHRSRLGVGSSIPLLALGALAWLAPTAAHAAGKSLEDYRMFRALTIDLVGRVPTRAELAAFEAPGFDVDAWIDARLGEDGYVERVKRIYVDALRLEVSPEFNFRPALTNLRRYAVKIAEPGGGTSTEWVYFRPNQSRNDAKYNRRFCFDVDDTGQSFVNNRAPSPLEATKAVPRATFDARVSKVKPWWLYRDFRAANPKDHYASWKTTAGRFQLEGPGDYAGVSRSATDTRILVNHDGTPTTEVAVCREETQVAPTATGTVRGVSTTVSCTSDLGPLYAKGCGCGPGLEWCTVGTGFGADPRSIMLASVAPLGASEPFELERRTNESWFRTAWNEEAHHFLATLAAEDRDFREVLTARWGVANGPVAQFYRAGAKEDLNDIMTLGEGATYANPEVLYDASQIPADLMPQEMDRWVKVPDRGPRAAGILTTAAFLAKFASRRGRAHAVYNAFLCKDFIAENVQLDPSTEPDLMKRPGCSTCHATLEPMAAFFARTKESSFAWIPAPIDNPFCAFKADGTSGSAACARIYDREFSTAKGGKLRGAYASPQNTNAGPAGLAAEVTQNPAFGTCVAKTVTESLLGRKVTSPGDDALMTSLSSTFTSGGHKLRALVRAVVKSDAYRYANSALRAGGGQ